MLFGLIGKKLSHSLSAVLFYEKFTGKHEYKLFEIENVKYVLNLLANEKNLKGLNVTLPFKEEIIKYLDEIDTVAAEIGSVNTLVVNNNRLKGYNTDYLGFEKAYIQEIKEKHKLCLILGTGGSSIAVAYVLKKYNVPYFYVSRTKRDEKTILYKDLNYYTNKYSILINTTPVGMFPDTTAMPDISDEALAKCKAVIDLIYNPEKTLLLQKAEKFGCKIYNGLEMLKQQALESWKIWNLV